MTGATQITTATPAVFLARQARFVPALMCVLGHFVTVGRRDATLWSRAYSSSVGDGLQVLPTVAGRISTARRYIRKQGARCAFVSPASLNLTDAPTWI